MIIKLIYYRKLVMKLTDVTFSNEDFEKQKQLIIQQIQQQFIINQYNEMTVNGQKWNYYNYFNRSLRISTSQLLLADLQDDLINYEHNLVYSNYYSDCSDLCLHYQNRVYWTLEPFKKLTELNDALWKSGGLLHPNCRHTIDLYYEDLDDELRVQDADKFDDIRKEYKASQQMRYNENQIRKWKSRQRKASELGQDDYVKVCKGKVSFYNKRPHNSFRVNNYYGI